MRSKMLGTKVINALYFILVYCICFEEVLGKMKFSLTNIKYLVAVILFCVVYRVSHPSFRQLKYTNGMKYFSIILFVAFLVSIPRFVLIDCDGLKIWKQYLWFPLFIYLFSQVERVSNLTVPLLINTFVKGMVGFTLISIFLYFVPLPIWNDYHIYWGRLTVGYPTIDTVLLCFAILLLLFYPLVRFSIIHKVIMGFILLVGTLMQASGTSLVLLAIILISMCCYLGGIGLSFRCIEVRNYKQNIKSFLFLIFLTGSVITSIYTFLSTKEPKLAETMMLQMENRLYILIGKEEESTLKDVNTMEDRKEKFAHVEQMYLNTAFSRIFGVGYSLVSMQDLSKERIVVEDQYHLNLATIGYLGTFIYFCMLYGIFKRTLRFWNRESLYLYVPSFFFILATSFSSFCIAAFSIIGVTALIYISMSREMINIEKI